MDNWNSGSAYEAYVGRWSRHVAREFVRWLNAPSDALWLDVGCGTGALTETILQSATPRGVVGIDRAEPYIEFARQHITDPRARFEVGDAQQLPVESATFDAVVSGLALNFVPDQVKAAAEFVRTAKPGGIVAVYIWDYADKMQFMRYFWDAAVALNPDAATHDEGPRFPICNPDALAALFQNAGLTSVKTRHVDVTTVFRDFEDYWSPFLGAQGPAPAYLASLSEGDRSSLRDTLGARLPIESDGSIHLIARAWAAKGIRA